MSTGGWTKLKPDEVILSGWRTIVRKTFSHPSGKEFVADTSDPIGSIAIATIALTSDNKVIVARQFRCGPEREFDELPGGGLEPGETPEEAATRELREETGYVPGAIEYLGAVYKHAWMNTQWHYFLATDCTLDVAGQQLDEFEIIDVELISIDQLFANARSARMTDTEAVFLAYDRLKGMKG